MKINFLIFLTLLLFFSACSTTRVGGHSDGKHHGVGVKTKVLKF
ncbi:hypothetical protein SMGD1_2456 [Sulfurimonas gotlandica GD1]|uniref:Lipoprotein n=1 Tax=Sulfurimonas gotlandica (strain DSM 19862 / JCM 16533 / GD1) TaxID=929558 RepID=B6BNA9_SULGG|nr:hypothetical protein [Sulfurimonas gotlandica]EDZ61358.1 hypothetical protein CBGD1_2424 [Sulfurimonas gotlandica GD1]EHP30979.1 hypothetical protein SMGD1_2456 [Sulfurimonas gotlandica GD1]